MSGAISEYADQLAQTGDGGYDKALLWPKQGYPKPDLRPAGQVLDDHEARIRTLEADNAHFKRLIHKYINPVDDYGNEVSE